MEKKVAGFIILAAGLVFVSVCGRADERASTGPATTETQDTLVIAGDTLTPQATEVQVNVSADAPPAASPEPAAEAEQETTAVALDPLAAARRSGRPVVADLGRGTCVPCKMMEPILKKLQEDYEGRAEILILDIDEFPGLTRELRIAIIPTQIFFDASGSEVGRHQGFMPEEDIVRQLKMMGVE